MNNAKRRTNRLFLVALCWATLPAYALTKHETDSLRHEVRLGWGDMLFETAVWHSTRHTDDYRYTGHLFAEYQYHPKSWLSVGMIADYEQVLWRQLDDNSQHTFYNIGLLPTVRFTYYFHEYVNLYSALFVGLNVNGGSDRDFRNRLVACAPAFGITALGVSVGKAHWFGAVEIGGLNALVSKDEIYMVGSRLFTASVGYRF